MAAEKKEPAPPCQWINGPQAFKEFATHKGKTQSARHIKPLHWYIACRLVIEGGFRPDSITPRPPFDIQEIDIKGKKESKGKPGIKGYTRYLLHYNAGKAGTGEQVILGGLKTKNVDVVVAINPIGPVVAVSCKGVTKAFRNLTNRMEETIGECTNLHITYPAMVIGYFALMRANRTIQDAQEAPAPEPEGPAAEAEVEGEEEQAEGATEAESAPTALAKALTAKDIETIKANDIAIQDDGNVSDGIIRFCAALEEMTGRRGIRDEISRYEAMSVALVESRGDDAGSVFQDFPEKTSLVHVDRFFRTLYERYEERFVFGAPLLVERGWTNRLRWDPESPALARTEVGSADWPELDFEPRLADPTT